MSRSGYSDDCDDNWAVICWRGAVASAIRGRRGQAFLREMLAALDALPEKRLASHEIVEDSDDSALGLGVCAIGAVAVARRLDVSGIDLEDREYVAGLFGIPLALAAEIVYENDEGNVYWSPSRREETPEDRYRRMRAWVEKQIRS